MDRPIRYRGDGLPGDDAEGPHHRGGTQAGDPVRFRIVAAAVCIIVGDTIRGRRALSRKVDPEQRFAAIIGPDGMDEYRTPSLMRGYARFINNGVRAAALSRPQIGLTEAEMEVLNALPDGSTLATIASSLGKSRKTVEKQVSSIYSKLQVTNRAQAVRRARDLGIFG